MRVYLHNKDILHVKEADSIALPIDGSGPKLYGGTTRRFMESLGITDLAELFCPPPYYPLLGESIWSELTRADSHYQWICCLDTLSHANSANHLANLRKSLRNAIRAMYLGDVGSRLACPILTGGNRVSLVDAVHVMLEEAVHDHSNNELHIAEINPGKFKVLRQLTRQFY